MAAYSFREELKNLLTLAINDHKNWNEVSLADDEWVEKFLETIERRLPREWEILDSTTKAGHWRKGYNQALSDVKKSLGLGKDGKEN